MNRGPAGQAASGGPLEVDEAPSPSAFGVAEPSRYEAGGLLGVGGMGEVRAAQDARLGRQVAVKSSLRGSAAELVREARLTARLVHPNIMAVHDAGEDDQGRPYYTMPVLRGRSLADAVAAASGLAARIQLVPHVLDASRAVAYAHSQGVLHRDLKPANVMVGTLGETVVADWGLATELGAADAPGEAVGTPGYMSPEVASGRTADARSDVFGLGAMLHAVLIGGDPGPGPLPAVRSRCPEAPPELAAIADRAAAADPAHRYPDAGALAADLAAWFQGQRVVAYAYSPAELAWRAVAAWRAPLAVAAIGLVVVAVAVAVGFVSTARQRDQAVAAREEAVSARAVADQRLKQLLVGAAIQAASDELPWRAEVLVAAALAEGASPDARGVLAWVGGRTHPSPEARTTLPTCNHLAVSPGRGRVVCEREGRLDALTVDGALIGSAAINPFHSLWLDEATVMYSAQDGELGLWRPPAAPEPLVGHVGGRARLVRDGERALAVGARSVSLWDAGALRPLEACGVGVGVGPRGALRGDTALVACQDGSVLALELGGGPPRRAARLRPELGVGAVVAVLPDGSGRFAVGTAKGRVVLFSHDGREELAVWDASADTIVHLAAAGEWLAAGLNDGRVRVWSTTTLRPAVILDDAAHQVEASADGCCLRVVGRRDTVWRMVSGGVPPRVAMPGGVSALDVSPAGDRLAAGCGDGTVRVVSLRDGAIERDLKWQDRVIKDVAWSPDGRELATVTSQNTPQRVFDTATWSTAWSAGALASKRVGWTPKGELVVLPYAMGMLRFGPDHVERATGLDLGLWDLVDGDRFMVVHAASGPAWTYADGRLFALPEVEAAHLVAPLGDDVLVVEADRVHLRTVWGAPLGDWRTQGRPIELSGSPGGRLFAVGTAEGPVELFAVDRAGPLAVLRGHAAQVAALAWTADGRWLVSGSWDASVRTWWLGDLETPADALRARAEAAWGWGLDDVLASP